MLIRIRGNGTSTYTVGEIAHTDRLHPRILAPATYCFVIYISLLSQSILPVNPYTYSISF